VTTETKSTNEDALGRAQEGAGAWQVFATELQSQGKGRRGRVWQSPFAQNLMFSLGRKTHVSTEMLYSASLIAGVAVVDALNLHSDIQFRLKWPNDIYVDGKKLGGILCEMQGNPLDEPLLVIGVGINVNAHPDNLDYPACSLKSLGVKNSDRTVLLASLVEQLVLMFSQDGPEYVAEVLVRWQDFDILKDRAVTIVQGPNVSHGVARGIDIKGQLVVEDESGRKKSLNGGEVSVKWC
jgi:BirA family biotin operon repressor/biotin-[acetyl-CoA-carboxylase] ligase